MRISMRQPMRQFVDQRDQFLFGAQVQPQSNLVAVDPAVNAGRQIRAQQVCAAALDKGFENLNAVGDRRHPAPVYVACWIMRLAARAVASGVQ